LFSVAVIKADGAAEIEVKEKKDRAEDAINATRVAGGGMGGMDF
jgi:chaperonin GroEL (HSP60 family)